MADKLVADPVADGRAVFPSGTRPRRMGRSDHVTTRKASVSSSKAG